MLDAKMPSLKDKIEAQAKEEVKIEVKEVEVKKEKKGGRSLK